MSSEFLTNLTGRVRYLRILGGILFTSGLQTEESVCTDITGRGGEGNVGSQPGCRGSSDVGWSELLYTHSISKENAVTSAHILQA
jgi:hypothetical protein